MENSGKEKVEVMTEERKLVENEFNNAKWCEAMVSDKDSNKSEAPRLGPGLLRLLDPS
ncbi:hypothetical protein CLV97_1612 [Planifilum fimeticola]|uniref:Uncharacterized protein n=1 Tax=Planifilum fimeticola TaxID=201975 RepID=A0A2T0L9R8_9BACL|nr:hypothetical protein CLV97_1612 [Planifilum fimeticola]